MPSDSSKSNRTRPSPETVEAERGEARAEHKPDREPTDDEAREAELQTLNPDVAEHYEEMTERGVEQKGEGRI
ncbi:MAG TPA: hypothetical protein VIC35_14795 [Acidimicrobiia bacterium]|jgi:hypothetical protein